jgi:riboflavin kinase
MTFSIRAQVIQGQGQGKKFVNLEWVRDQIRDKFGFTPYPGTLNLRLDSSNMSSFQIYIQSHHGISIGSNLGGCEGLCYRIRVNGLTGIILIPQVPDYSRKQLEVIASVNLRNALSLDDGDEIEIFVVNTTE